MPPKKDDKSTPAETLHGFEQRETKLLAAAFVSLLGPDKYDYDLMAALTGNTAGSLKKMFPPVKRKAMEAHPSFATFLGATPVTDGANGEEKKAVSKSGGRKRKATSETATEGVAKSEDKKTDDYQESGDSKKKALNKGPGRPRGKKAEVDKEKVKDEPTPEEDEANSNSNPEDDI